MLLIKALQMYLKNTSRNFLSSAAQYIHTTNEYEYFKAAFKYTKVKNS